MPTLQATPLPAYGWVRVAYSWPEASWATYALLERVDVLTGEVTPIRPHTDYSGWYQRLSGGGALQYDTEAPLDRAFVYRLSAMEEPGTYYYPRTPWVSDDFARTVAAGGWGTATSGQVWAVNSGPAHSVASGTGRQSHSGTNAIQVATLNTGSTAQRVQVDAMDPTLPTGAAHTLWALAGAADDANWVAARVAIATSGAATLSIQKRVAGVFQTALGSVSIPGTHVAGHWWRIELDLADGRVRARAWNLNTGTRPTAWQLDVYNTGPSLGALAGAATRLETGSTNVTPVVFQVDNVVVTSRDVAAGTQYTLTSGDGFWLRSPLKPYKDRRVLLRPTPGCPPPSSIFFVGNDPRESRDANAGVVSPVNRRLATAISRPRQGVSSSMTLVTRTFTDRDAVLDTLDDGTALQFVAPPAYGLPTRYMSVGTVDVQRGLSDHRFEARVFNLPYTQVAQPAGPAAGVLGARHRDLCATYATWDAAAAASATYDSMMTVA